MASRSLCLNLIQVVLLTATLVLFQNCGKAATPSLPRDSSDSTSTEPTILGSTQDFTKIIFDPLLELGDGAGLNTTIKLTLDLVAGNVTYLNRATNQIASCAVDGARLNVLRDLMLNASICEPGPLPPGMQTCLAFAPADIRLANSSTHIDLRPVICHSGAFLCGDADAKLRSLLANLRDQAPPNCN